MWTKDPPLAMSHSCGCTVGLKHNFSESIQAIVFIVVLLGWDHCAKEYDQDVRLREATSSLYLTGGRPLWSESLQNARCRGVYAPVMYS
jgi:hypothetical protein